MQLGFCIYVCAYFKTLIYKWVFQVQSLNFLKFLLLNHCLPFSFPIPYRKSVDLSLNFGSPFSHVVFNIEHKWMLPKISIYNFAWCLKPYCRVQVWLQEII